MKQDMIFEPSADLAKSALIDANGYAALYQDSIANPDQFWAEHGKRIDWIKPYSQISDVSYDAKDLHIKWYADGTLNAAANCLDRHLATRGDQTAIIWEGDEPDQHRHITYRELHEEVWKFANVLKANGAKKGDRITIYMPMIPEAVIAMWGCGRIGAIHSVVFGGFAANELANRIDDSKAKLILTASCGIEPGRIVEYQPLINEAINIAKHKPLASIFFRREQKEVELAENQIDWNEFIKDVVPDLIESTPKSGPTVLSSTTSKGVGKAPDLRSKAKSVAS